MLRAHNFTFPDACTHTHTHTHTIASQPDLMFSPLKDAACFTVRGILHGSELQSPREQIHTPIVRVGWSEKGRDGLGKDKQGKVE